MTPNVAWSDNQLMATINAAQQNNEAALKALCHKYEGLIHKYAHVSAVQCEANDIESLLWEVFIRAVKECDSCHSNKNYSMLIILRTFPWLNWPNNTASAARPCSNINIER